MCLTLPKAYSLLRLLYLINVSARYTVEDTGEFSSKTLKRTMDHLVGSRKERLRGVVESKDGKMGSKCEVISLTGGYLYNAVAAPRMELIP